MEQKIINTMTTENPNEEQEKNLTVILGELQLAVGESLYFHNMSKETFEGLINLNLGIHKGINGYYEVVKGTKNNPKHIRRLTNFTLDLKSKVTLYKFNSNDDTHFKYEITVVIENNLIDITLGCLELQNLTKFQAKMEQYAHLITVMDERQHKNLVARVISSNEQPVDIIEFQTAGYNLIGENQLFLTANSCYCYGTQESSPKTIRLSLYAGLHPVFTEYDKIMANENMKNFEGINSPEILVSKLLKLLFEMLDKAYNKRIEPYLAVSMSFLTLFLKQISNDFVATPIVALYGEAASGKTNLLRLIAKSYGLDNSALHGGMDTTAGIIEDFENYVNIPLLIDEVEVDGEDRIKSIIKSVYGHTCRKKFRHKNNINTTLFFNTNNYFLYGTEYKNRCIELNFKQNDFNCHEAEKFNKFQDFLSFVSAYIIQNTEYAEIKHSIKQAETSALLSKLNDNRIKRNLAIAVTGLTLLIKLINSEDFTFEMFEERLAEYIKGINNIADNEIEKFLTVLKELLDERYGKLRKDEDYLIYDDGIHILTGETYGKFSTHFKNTFARLFKNEKPLDMKKYYDLLKNSGAVMKNVYYSRYKQTRYGLYLSFQSFNELAYRADNSESYTYNLKNVENDALISPCPF